MKVTRSKWRREEGANGGMLSNAVCNMSEQYMRSKGTSRQSGLHGEAGSHQPIRAADNTDRIANQVTTPFDAVRFLWSVLPPLRVGLINDK